MFVFHSYTVLKMFYDTCIYISKRKSFYSVTIVSQYRQKIYIDTQKVHNNYAKQWYYSSIK